MKKGKRIGHRRKGIHWDYDFDGLHLNERWDKKDKKYWGRWLKRQAKQDTKERVEDGA